MAIEQLVRAGTLSYSVDFESPTYWHWTNASNGYTRAPIDGEPLDDYLATYTDGVRSCSAPTYWPGTFQVSYDGDSNLPGTLGDNWQQQLAAYCAYIKGRQGEVLGTISKDILFSSGPGACSNEDVSWSPTVNIVLQPWVTYEQEGQTLIANDFGFEVEHWKYDGEVAEIKFMLLTSQGIVGDIVTIGPVPITHQQFLLSLQSTASLNIPVDPGDPLEIPEDTTEAYVIYTSQLNDTWVFTDFPSGTYASHPSPDYIGMVSAGASRDGVAVGYLLLVGEGGGGVRARRPMRSGPVSRIVNLNTGELEALLQDLRDISPDGAEGVLTLDANGYRISHVAPDETSSSIKLRS